MHTPTQTTHTLTPTTKCGGKNVIETKRKKNKVICKIILPHTLQKHRTAPAFAVGAVSFFQNILNKNHLFRPCVLQFFAIESLSRIWKQKKTNNEKLRKKCSAEENSYTIRNNKKKWHYYGLITKVRSRDEGAENNMKTAQQMPDILLSRTSFTSVKYNREENPKQTKKSDWSAIFQNAKQIKVHPHKKNA